MFSNKNGKNWPPNVPTISSNVFDQNYWHAFIFGDYILSTHWLISISYGRRQGDFNSACTAKNVNKVFASIQVKAIIADNIFNGCVYRVNGKTNIYSTTLSYALSNHSAINLTTNVYQGQAKELNYHSSDIQLSYNYRY